MRIIYLGTPEFAVPTLKKLLSWPDGQVVAVVTQPDRPSGRKQKLAAPPIKLVAQEHGIPVWQPEKLSRSAETLEAMRAAKPDILVMVAFGQILKKPVLTLAPYGVLNLHGSLLPRYRGPAPVNWAIINGDTTAGVTTMLCDEGVDTGPVLLKRAITVGGDTTAEELARVLADIGADLIVETLERIASGDIVAEPQDDSASSYAPMLKKEMALIDWGQPGFAVHNLVRGLLPWPVAFTQFADAPLKVFRTALLSTPAPSGAVAGTVVELGDCLTVACGDGQTVAVVEVQPPNRARMSAKDWANGVRLKPGAVFGR